MIEIELNIQIYHQILNISNQVKLDSFGCGEKF